ncbi:MAG: S1 RNA-binding domain-containing protein [Candidatus Merdivicinus sp.]|jgi:small subunit ribosomal protein S1
MREFQPEGFLYELPENRAKCHSLNRLREAMSTGEILEARAAVCDSCHNLIVDLGGGIKGIIPREECALGIAEGTVRDIAILSRVNKPVCFMVTGFREEMDGQLRPILSRRKAQERCRMEWHRFLRPGDILPARVTHLEQFGAFVDIGCGIISLLPIDAISISRISHPRDRFEVGQDIFAIVKSIEGDRITLSHRELLGNWEENAALFEAGETVSGIVRSVEEYGIFVELTPNLAGLAERRENVFPGQMASVYIKSILPDKMKIKLILIDAFHEKCPPAPIRYYQTSGRMDRWTYSTPESGKTIETVFTDSE